MVIGFVRGIAILLTMAVIMMAAYLFKKRAHERAIEINDPCPVTTQSTGHILCWSGGVLVYDSPTYRNGGYLCTPTGDEIEIESIDNDFCVQISRQNSVWNPPQ